MDVTTSIPLIAPLDQLGVMNISVVIICRWMLINLKSDSDQSWTSVSRQTNDSLSSLTYDPHARKWHHINVEDQYTEAYDSATFNISSNANDL